MLVQPVTPIFLRIMDVPVTFRSKIQMADVNIGDWHAKSRPKTQNPSL